MPDASLTIDGVEVLKKTSGEINLTNTNFVPNSSFMFRNKIINGNFDFWQRSTSQTATSGYGSADRWSPLYVGSARTASQQPFTNGQTDVPNNPKYYFRHAVTSSSGSGNYVHTYQAIEDVRILAGKTVTLSFYAKADSNKNIATEFTQWFGTGGSPSSWNNGLSVTTHSLTTSWQKFTTTVSIPHLTDTGLVGGTPKIIGTDANSSYTGIYFHFEAGSDLNARTNSLGQPPNNTIYQVDIAQVQLEEGTVATPFEYRPIGVELSLCQRYYQVFTYCNFAGRGASSDTCTFGVPLANAMRSMPTLTYTDAGGNAEVIAFGVSGHSNRSNATLTADPNSGPSGTGFRVITNGVFSGLTDNRPVNVEVRSRLNVEAEF